MKKKLGSFVQKYIARYFYPNARITITVEYVISKVPLKIESIVIRHPRKPKKILVRKDLQSNLWKYYKPTIKAVPSSSGEMHYLLHKFHWETLSIADQIKLNEHQAKNPTEPITLTFTHSQFTAQPLIVY